MHAQKVLAALNAAIKRAKAHGRFKPVVIAISNGSEVVEKSFIDDWRTRTFGVALDPVATLESVRGSVSRRYEAALRAQVKADKGEYLSVPLLHGKCGAAAGLDARAADDGRDGQTSGCARSRHSERVPPGGNVVGDCG